MASYNLVNDKEQIVFGKDSITIQKYISGLKGGRVLDIPEGFTPKNILAGHIVITDGNGKYMPMPVTGNAYASLPSGYTYCGVVYRSVSTNKPVVSIMTNGEVNSEALPYQLGSIATAFKTACPHIVFIKDEEA